MQDSTDPTTETAAAPKKGSDAAFLVVATLVILAIGGAIGGTIFFLSRGGNTTTCGQVNAGSLSDLVPRAKTAPNFVVGSGNCQFWLAYRDGKLVAIKPTIAHLDNCKLDYKPSNNTWVCGSHIVSYPDFDYLKTSIGTGTFKQTLIVDFGDETSTSS